MWHHVPVDLPLFEECQHIRFLDSMIRGDSLITPAKGAKAFAKGKM
jgi:hypothetical protein